MAEDDDDDTDSDDDDEFTGSTLPQKPQNGAATSVPHPLSAPPLQASVSGTKRPRDDEGDDEDADGEDGEFEESSKVVNKKARATAEEEV